MSAGSRRVGPSSTTGPATASGAARSREAPSAETSMPETSLPNVPFAIDKGKRVIASEFSRHEKRTRFEVVVLFPSNPVAAKFNPFAILDPLWSSRVIAERVRLIEDANKDERDPTIATARAAIVLLQNLQATYVTRQDLL